MKVFLVFVFFYIVMFPFVDFLDVFCAQKFFIETADSSLYLFAKFIENITYIPFLVVFFFSIIAVFFSIRNKEPKKMYLPLTLIFHGVVNLFLICYGLLKNNLYRPRPIATKILNGTLDFISISDMKLKFANTIDKFQSFPSGHVASAAFFYIFYFIGKRNEDTKMVFFGLTFGTIFSIFVAFSRIAIGEHFFSDVFSSLVLMIVLALLIDFIVYSTIAKNFRSK